MSQANPLKPPKAPSGRPFPKGPANPKYGKPRSPGQGRQKGTQNKIPKPFKQWILEFLNSEKYRKSVEGRLLAGTAPSLELLACHWHGGRPKETKEINIVSLDKLYALALERNMVKRSELRTIEAKAIEAGDEA